MKQMHPPTISLSAMFTEPKLKRLVNKYDFWLRTITGIRKLESYNKLVYQDVSADSPWCRWLKHLKIDYNVEFTSVDKIPATGALIIIANHPFGMLDGILLGSLLRRIRKDIKIMVNQVLTSVDNLAPDLIGVDP